MEIEGDYRRHRNRVDPDGRVTDQACIGAARPRPVNLTFAEERSAT